MSDARKSSLGSELTVLLDGTEVGTVKRNSRGRYRFMYDAHWRRAEDAYPLSLSMPLTAEEHDHVAVEAFLWGLLPDNTQTLDHYARMFGVSAQSPMAILGHIGADCAGAVQLVPPEEAELYKAPSTDAEVEWIDDEEIARELQSAKRTGLPGSDRRTTGRFSLAGAQPKIALFKGGDGWGKPKGRTPTTHILKPPVAEFADFAENEHLCLALAGELGLGAAQSEVRTFNGEVAIVVERFDRLPSGSGIRRVHQEDLCQAMSVLPWRKYENEGGPGVARIIALIQESSAEPEKDVGRFLDMIALNWVLAATDAHAKNYAVLHAAGGGVRLAPFYDVASFLPYVDERLHEVKLAMRIGQEYLVYRVARSDWNRMAVACRLTEQYVSDQIERLLSRIPKAMERVASLAIASGLRQEPVAKLARLIVARSRECEDRLARGIVQL